MPNPDTIGAIVMAVVATVLLVWGIRRELTLRSCDGRPHLADCRKDWCNTSPSVVRR